MLLMLAAYIPSVLCCIHVIRTQREQFWLWVLIMAPLLGPIVYIIAVVAPELMGGRTARRMGRATIDALAPERELNAARSALADTPTVGNHMRAARAAAALGRWRDALEHWDQAAAGSHADDAAVLLGRAHALLELERFGEAFDAVKTLRAQGGREGEAGAVVLARARALEGLGRSEEAEAPYRFAADAVPGLEAGARYVAFMARQGRGEDAAIGFAEIERRYSKVSAPLRAEAKRWRDLAARAVGQT